MKIQGDLDLMQCMMGNLILELQSARYVRQFGRTNNTDLNEV